MAAWLASAADSSAVLRTMGSADEVMVPMLGSTGTQTRSSFPAMDETSQPIELLLSVTRTLPHARGADRGSAAARDPEGTLKAGARVPSTRDLARQLDISRRVVVGAYEQLAAEGYLALRQGARPRVSGAALRGDHRIRAGPAPQPTFDFHPRAPDVSQFPRTAWLRLAPRGAGGDDQRRPRLRRPRGVAAARRPGGYLGRVRGVAADPARVVVTSGYSQGQGIVCRVLAAQGARRIAFENPSHAEQRRIAARAGLEIVPVAVDEAGIRVEELERADVDAVVLTPPTSTPPARSWPATGARSCSPGCEPAARSPSRTTTTPSTATTGRRSGLQGRAPDRIVYAGSASKTLAPALRLGWLVVPPRLLDAVADEKDLDDCGTARIEQQAFADFLARGELDRHLRRMRAQYRRRRTCSSRHWPTRSRKRPCAASPPGCTPPSSSPTATTSRPSSTRPAGDASA